MVKKMINYDLYDVIFFDFDGVIKESLDIKSDAFKKLFEKYGPEVSRKVLEHHNSNMGVSRFIKIPLYLGFAGIKTNEKLIKEYENHFSELVFEGVLKSDWVPGILSFLKKNYDKKHLFILTATPHQEINEIARILKINFYFREIIGSPTSKSKAINNIIKLNKFEPSKCLMIGDSKSDHEATIDSEVSFILRKTKYNQDLQFKFNFKMINNFNNE